MTLSDTLRQATRSLHTQVEQLPLAEALVQGHVGRSAYGALLEQLYHLHDSLENLLEQAQFSLPVYRVNLARRQLILRDLEALGLPEPDQVLEQTAELTSCFRAWSVNTPHSLLGALYVFEGSRLGSMHLVRPLAQALRVSPTAGNGLDYHLDGMADRIAQWKAFQARLEAVGTTDDLQACIREGAVATFAGLYEIYAVLEPAARVPVAVC